VRRAILILAAVALLAPSIAQAASCRQTPVADLEDVVLCPVCGTTLGLAREAPLAKRERALIKRLINSCHSKQQIKDELVAEFGPAVLAEPPDRGIGIAAYLVPLAAGALALAGVLAAFGRWRRREPQSQAAPPAQSLSRAELRALEAELEDLR
jgi:cytochrome c-type biogenesis protein CcmH